MADVMLKIGSNYAKVSSEDALDIAQSLQNVEWHETNWSGEFIAARKTPEVAIFFAPKFEAPPEVKNVEPVAIDDQQAA